MGVASIYRTVRYRSILKIWPLNKKFDKLGVTDVFNLYLKNGASYGFHVIDTFYPYDPRMKSICHLALLELFSNVNPV